MGLLQREQPQILAAIGEKSGYGKVVVISLEQGKINRKLL